MEDRLDALREYWIHWYRWTYSTLRREIEGAHWGMQNGRWGDRSAIEWLYRHATKDHRILSLRMYLAMHHATHHELISKAEWPEGMDPNKAEACLLCKADHHSVDCPTLDRLLLP